MNACEELAAISAAIGSVRFMDPPDGGDASLAEQVTRMRQALERTEDTIKQVRAHFRVEYPTSKGGKPSIGYDSEALPKVIALLDAVIAPAANVEPFDDKWLGDGPTAHVLPSDDR